MSDTTTNQFVGRGTAADMAAFTPNPPTPANAPPLNGYTFFNTDDGLLYCWDGAAWVAVGGGSSTSLTPFLANGRLTTETGVPISTSDRTAQGTIYYTPAIGNQIALYSGSAWAVSTFTERSLALTVTSGKNYDVFLYDNAGTLTLELSAAWTNDTTRADALVLQDGVYVKSGATTRRLLGTLRASAANVTEDSAQNRFVWNYQNAVVRPMLKAYATTYSYSTNTYRETNNVTTERLNWVQGLTSNAMCFQVASIFEQNSATPEVFITLAIDSATTPHTASTYDKIRLVSFQYQGGQAALFAATTLGFHYCTMLEKVNNGTVNMNNDSLHVLSGTIVN